MAAANPNADLAGFEELDPPFTHGAIRHRVFWTGDGSPVLVLHELPGLSPAALRFGRRLAARGFRVYLPLLFGEPGQDDWRGSHRALLHRAPRRHVRGGEERDGNASTRAADRAVVRRASSPRRRRDGGVLLRRGRHLSRHRVSHHRQDAPRRHVADDLRRRERHPRHRAARSTPTIEPAKRASSTSTSSAGTRARASPDGPWSTRSRRVSVFATA